MPKPDVIAMARKLGAAMVSLNSDSGFHRYKCGGIELAQDPQKVVRDHIGQKRFEEIINCIYVDLKPVPPGDSPT